jgi:hypothetical protein
MVKGDLGGYASLQQLSVHRITKFGLGSMKKAAEITENIKELR